MTWPLAAIVTTIHPPSASVRRLTERIAAGGGHTWVAGDAVGPASYDVADCTFLDIATQRSMDGALASRLPERHYARKNLAFLAALRAGVGVIYETDDDNAPNEAWQPRTAQTTARVGRAGVWCNVLRAFTDAPIWPRGFPLELVPASLAADAVADATPRQVTSTLQQGLVDGDPDVDALFRMQHPQPPPLAAAAPSLHVPPGTFAPVNSQSTWWWPPAFPLCYLPSHCSQRATDIWRGLVAQRCLWALGQGVVFHAAEVDHARNPHDWWSDLRAELPCYLYDGAIAERLRALDLEPGDDAVAANLRRCWAELVAMGVVPAAELELVDAWCADLRAIEVD